MTRTASDQSTSSGTASGSLRTASAISLSVKASTAAQSVFPCRRSCRKALVELSPFFARRAASRDEPADFAADRECGEDFPIVDVAENFVPDFAMTIRSTDDVVTIENSFHVLKVDLVLT
jgi:hypothetical protein